MTLTRADDDKVRMDSSSLSIRSEHRCFLKNPLGDSGCIIFSRFGLPRICSGEKTSEDAPLSYQLAVDASDASKTTAQLAAVYRKNFVLSFSKRDSAVVAS